MNTRNRSCSAAIAGGILLLVFLLFSVAQPRPALGANFFQGVSPTNVPWAGGVVPYVFATNITPAQEAVYLAGLEEWELAANVKFVARSNESHYVLLKLQILPDGTGMYQDGNPAVLTMNTLKRSVICHEGGHLFGLQHEHQRIDRDSYIVVNYTNIVPGAMSQFVKDTNSVSFGPYELDSVMHYNRHNFSIDDSVDSIDPLPAYQNYLDRLGNLVLSRGDFAALEYLYGPAALPLTNEVTTTADGGFGSLRAAIYYANDHPGTTVSFNISTNDPGYTNGVFTIYLTGELPPLVSTNTVIDGTTQPGCTDRPVIALDGSGVYWAAGDVSGLYVFGSNCVVKALALNNFPDSGIRLLYPEAAGNRVEACFVGLGPDGISAAPNEHRGVNISGGAHDNVIGGTNATQRNVVSGNVGSGIEISGAGSDRNVILGNYIGLDDSGALAVPNVFNGINLSLDAQDTIIGAGAADGSGRNVISGNYQYGLSVSGSNTTGLVLQGNYIGTDASGDLPVANFAGGIGVLFGAHDLNLGGTNFGSGNVISGNGGDGVQLQGLGVCNVVVQGNLIGLNASGTSVISNSLSGISISGGACGNVVGGTANGAANVISGNMVQGLRISDSGTSNNVVQGNLIGTGPEGTNAFPNEFVGVSIRGGASGNLIGGTGPCAGNVISGNDGYGVLLGDTDTSRNVVQANLVGVDRTGTNALANSSVGVVLSGGATQNVIGGTNTGAANVIAHNGSDGIALFDNLTTGNTIRGNAIFDNDGLGLNLVGGLENFFGVTENDADDADTGPNNLQNFPEITDALANGGITTINGTLQSGTNRIYWIDLYRNTTADASGNGEGERYLGSVCLTTDTNGTGCFSYTATNGWAGQFLTATATDAETGDTSEFSSVLQPAVPPPLLHVDPLAWGTNGFSFNMAVQTNQTYRVQATTNLGDDPVVWVDLTNFLATSPQMPFIDNDATNWPMRFYRAVAP